VYLDFVRAHLAVGALKMRLAESLTGIRSVTGKPKPGPAPVMKQKKAGLALRIRRGLSNKVALQFLSIVTLQTKEGEQFRVTS
jgi:hypothetical protein